jgi:hypothetical protein
MCVSCRRFQPEGEDWPPSCEAFDAIPADILASRFDHRQPHPGDHGLQFVQDPEKPDLDPIEELLARAGTR